ncbi:hypothetical protein MRX96_057433 [Rhipicephalus microplus]
MRLGETLIRGRFFGEASGGFRNTGKGPGQRGLYRPSIRATIRGKKEKNNLPIKRKQKKTYTENKGRGLQQRNGKLEGRADRPVQPVIAFASLGATLSVGGDHRLRIPGFRRARHTGEQDGRQNRRRVPSTQRGPPAIRDIAFRFGVPRCFTEQCPVFRAPFLYGIHSGLLLLEPYHSGTRNGQKEATEVTVLRMGTLNSS